MNSVVLKTHPACYCWNANFIINNENTNDVMNYVPQLVVSHLDLLFLSLFKNHICVFGLFELYFRIRRAENAAVLNFMDLMFFCSKYNCANMILACVFVYFLCDWINIRLILV